MLNENIHQHSLNIGVDLSTYTERSLIMARLGVTDICTEDEVICPYHRYSYGIYWRPSTLCQSSYHQQKKPKGTHPLPANYYKKFLEMELFNPLSPIVAKMLHVFYNYFSQHNLSKLALNLFE